MKNTLIFCVASTIIFSVVGNADAQDLGKRIKRAREKLAQQKAAKVDRNPVGQTRNIAVRLGDTVDPVQIEEIPAKRVLEWWSDTTQIPLIINWTALESEGIDPEQLITLKLRRVPAGKLLSLLMSEISQVTTLMYQVTPWYVRIMTKEQANRQSVVRIYDIRDLLHEVPDFTNAPKLDLNSALSNTSSGGSNGGGQGGGGGGAGQGLFGDAGGEDEKVEKTREEKAEEIADLIRGAVETDLWAANGGEYGSIKYFNGSLIIKAPLYVHNQIGMPAYTIGRRSNDGVILRSGGR